MKINRKNIDRYREAVNERLKDNVMMPDYTWIKNYKLRSHVATIHHAVSSTFTKLQIMFESMQVCFMVNVFNVEFDIDDLSMIAIDMKYDINRKGDGYLLNQLTATLDREQILNEKDRTKRKKLLDEILRERTATVRLSDNYHALASWAGDAFKRLKDWSDDYNRRHCIGQFAKE